MNSTESSRIVLQANIGQFDVSKRVLSNGILALNSTDTDGSGGINCSIFAQRSQMSGGIGDPVFTSFKPNSRLFLRRIRIASEQQAYGAKLINRGGYHTTLDSQRPILYPNSSWFQLWANNLADNSQIGKIYEANELPVLNEWYDVNQIIFPLASGVENISIFFSGVFNIEVDFTDIPSRLVGEPVQVRLEIEADYSIGSINAAPLIPPTTAKAQSTWSIYSTLASRTLGATGGTFRAKYKNTFGQPIKSIQAIYAWVDAAGLNAITGVYLGQDTFSGSNLLDASTWTQLLFSGSGTLAPVGSFSLDSPGVFATDSLILPSPIPVGDSFILSSAYTIGSLGLCFPPEGGPIVTPISTTIQEARYVNGDHAFDSGVVWTATDGLSPIAFKVGF